MNLNIVSITEMIAVVGFFIGFMKYLIVQPLQASIDSLKEALKELKQVLTLLEQEQNDIVRRLTVVEESTKAAHRRLDEMTK